MKRRVVSVPVAGGNWLRLECGHQQEQAVGAGDLVDCGGCDRGRPPPGLRVARRTPVFTCATTPAGLRSSHRTTVWAQLVVMAGTLDFHDEHPPAGWSRRATIGDTVTLVPDRPHSITPSSDAEFFIRFYHPVLPGSGPRPGGGVRPRVAG